MFFPKRIFYLQCSDFYGTLRASTSVKIRVYANTRATCKFLLHSTLAASFSRIYQTLLTIYWHCDVIDLSIYLGTEKWLNISFSQRDGRNIPFPITNERFNSIARLCKDHNTVWNSKKLENRTIVRHIQFNSCSGLVSATNSESERRSWI